MQTVQTLKLRPMSETPERWPVRMFRVDYPDTTVSIDIGAFEVAKMLGSRGFWGWVYDDQLKFEVKE